MSRTSCRVSAAAGTTATSAEFATATQHKAIAHHHTKAKRWAISRTELHTVRPAMLANEPTNRNTLSDRTWVSAETRLAARAPQTASKSPLRSKHTATKRNDACPKCHFSPQPSKASCGLTMVHEQMAVLTEHEIYGRQHHTVPRWNHKNCSIRHNINTNKRCTSVC
jgi:hypothetical protein